MVEVWIYWNHITDSMVVLPFGPEEILVHAVLWGVCVCVCQRKTKQRSEGGKRMMEGEGGREKENCLHTLIVCLSRNWILYSGAKSPAFFHYVNSFTTLCACEMCDGWSRSSCFTLKSHPPCRAHTHTHTQICMDKLHWREREGCFLDFISLLQHAHRNMFVSSYQMHNMYTHKHLHVHPPIHTHTHLFWAFHGTVWSSFWRR